MTKNKSQSNEGPPWHDIDEETAYSRPLAEFNIDSCWRFPLACPSLSHDRSPCCHRTSDRIMEVSMLGMLRAMLQLSKLILVAVLLSHLPSVQSQEATFAPSVAQLQTNFTSNFSEAPSFLETMTTSSPSVQIIPVSQEAALNVTDPPGASLSNHLNSTKNASEAEIYPTQAPSFDQIQLLQATNETNVSYAPPRNNTMNPSVTTTIAPSLSAMPSFPPSISPSWRPSVSAQPSLMPSVQPSDMPSVIPSEIPSASPTHNVTEIILVNFIQKFTLDGSKFFNDTEKILFQNMMANYTQEFDEMSIGRVNTTCMITGQKSTVPPLIVGTPQSRLLRTSGGPLGNEYANNWRRSLQTFVNSVEYRMTYESDFLNVTGYPTQFELFINQNLTRVTNDLNDLGIRVSASESVARLFFQTPQPTTSPQPSDFPTQRPSISVLPSSPPSSTTFPPTAMVTDVPLPSLAPSSSPSIIPTPSPGVSESDSKTTLIVVVVVVIASVVMIGLFVFYRRRKHLQELRYQASAATGIVNQPKSANPVEQGPIDGSWNAAVGKSAPQKSAPQKSALHMQDPRIHCSPEGRGPLGEGLISPSESLMSNQSLLSAGYSMGGDSGDEADMTHNLQDEFDQYKDQNLEKMRAEVEGNLTGFDGMMSQALTKALMDDDDLNVDPTELLWGGVRQQSGAEIEASALCEVTDWLKRNENASVDGK
jgi:hypothetical protein